MDNKMYGAWISKNEFIPVKYEEHIEEGCKLLEKIFKRDILIKGNFSLYSLMFRLGYVRLVFYGNGYNVEYWQGAKLSRLQRDYIENAENKDTAKVKIYGWEFCKIS